MKSILAILVYSLFSQVFSFHPSPSSILRPWVTNPRPRNGDRSMLNAIVSNPVEEMQGDSFDVLVCGAGPGGLLLAVNLAKEGCSVGVVDPILDKPWPNNYGVWMDEAEPFG